MKKGALKGIVCLVVIVVIWMAVSFRSKPLSEEGEISLENFVVCRVQTMEIKNDTGYEKTPVQGKGTLVKEYKEWKRYYM